MNFGIPSNKNGKPQATADVKSQVASAASILAAAKPQDDTPSVPVDRAPEQTTEEYVKQIQDSLFKFVLSPLVPDGEKLRVADSFTGALEQRVGIDRTKWFQSTPTADVIPDNPMAALSSLETGDEIDSDALAALLSLPGNQLPSGLTGNVTPYLPENFFSMTYTEDDGVDCYHFSVTSQVDKPFDPQDVLALLTRKIKEQFQEMPIEVTQDWVDGIADGYEQIKNYMFNNPERVGEVVVDIEVRPGKYRKTVKGSKLSISIVFNEVEDEIDVLEIIELIYQTPTA